MCAVCLCTRHRFGGAPNHADAVRHWINNHRARAHDRVAAQAYTLLDGRPNADPSALADVHATGQVSSRADVDAGGKSAIVVDRRARVDNACLPHRGTNIDGRTSQDDAARAQQLGVRAHPRRRVDQGRQVGTAGLQASGDSEACDAVPDGDSDSRMLAQAGNQCVQVADNGPRAAGGGSRPQAVIIYVHLPAAGFGHVRDGPAMAAGTQDSKGKEGTWGWRRWIARSWGGRAHFGAGDGRCPVHLRWMRNGCVHQPKTLAS